MRVMCPWERCRHLPSLLTILALSALGGCDGLPVLAPTGSTVALVASPAVIPLNGESVITASVTEESGTPVQNGTVVTFSTTLGTFDAQEAPTTDGRASARLLAGTVSGIATVTAFSGNVVSEALSIQIGDPVGP